PPTLAGLARPALELVDRLGFPRSLLAQRCVPTPACGLAGASVGWARQAHTLARQLAAAFADPPDSRARGARGAAAGGGSRWRAGQWACRNSGMSSAPLSGFTLEPVQTSDAAAIRDWYELCCAVAQADQPQNPPPCWYYERGRVRHPWPGEEERIWL